MKERNVKMKKNREPGNEFTLSDMIRGIQYCVNSGVEIVEQHYIKTLEKFFYSDGTPVTKTININENSQIDVPLICLSNHGSLDFEEMRIKTKMSIDGIKEKEIENELEMTADENYEITRGSFSMSLGGVHKDNNETSTAEIEMVFKRTDPPEALSRVIDYINNMVKIKERTD